MTPYILLVLLLLVWNSATAAQELPDPDILARLSSGEVILDKVHSDKAGSSARAKILIRAPVESVWSVIVSCKHAFMFVEGLEHCDILEERGVYALTHQVVKKRFPAPTQDFIFETWRKPHERMDFSLASGNLKTMEGNWEFVSGEHGVIINYEILIKPGIPAPAFLVLRDLKKTMPAMLACIRGLADGSGTAERQREDLDLCPGETMDRQEGAQEMLPD